MDYVKLTHENQNKIIKRAIEVLNNGGIVSYPTETFYALGVRFDINKGLNRLYQIKKRHLNNPFPLIIGNKSQLKMLVTEIGNIEEKLMDRYWPGPLTILFTKKKSLSNLITSTDGKVAVRVPGESFAQFLAKKACFPITATSANLSGSTPARDAKTVLEYFEEKIDMIIDSGATKGDMPSTIVDIINDRIKIVREGMIKKSSLVSVYQELS